jgi:CheY-like chemotaxis protein
MHMPLTDKRIVVAEDDPDQMEYLTAILEDNGAKVFRAHNGNEALELARDVDPDVVTLDIQMPGTDVIEVLRQFSSDVELIDICLCIISGRPELRQFLVDKFAGRCRAFVDKPYEPDQVVEALTRLTCE